MSLQFVAKCLVFWFFPQRLFVQCQIPVTLLETSRQKEWVRDKEKEREVERGRERGWTEGKEETGMRGKRRRMDAAWTSLQVSNAWCMQRKLQVQWKRKIKTHMEIREKVSCGIKDDQWADQNQNCQMEAKRALVYAKCIKCMNWHTCGWQRNRADKVWDKRLLLWKWPFWISLSYKELHFAVSQCSLTQFLIKSHLFSDSVYCCPPRHLSKHHHKSTWHGAIHMRALISQGRVYLSWL